MPKTRAVALADELRRLIQNGELAPGLPLRQTEIATRFGVSTTPVREAFTSLSREGWVNHDAHRGVVVFQPRLEDLEENYEIRTVLEPLAAGIATKQLSQDELDRLDELVAEMNAETADLLRYHELNRRFHATIYAAAQRPRLAQTIESLRDSADIYLRIIAARSGNSDSTYQRQIRAEHEAIAAALRKGNVRSVRKIVGDHLKHNYRQIMSVMGDPD